MIPHPVILEGEKVKLEPLEAHHIEQLCRIAGNKRIWEFMPLDGSNPALLKEELLRSIALREKGQQYPFVVRNKQTGELIGSTRYIDIQPEHRNLEIGWTWYVPECWGKGYNEECKWLLLKYSFETLGCIRVQIKAWDRNMRSRRAIERIGAIFEGVMRQNVIRYNGPRSTAVYSILPEEWEGVEKGLKEAIRKR